MLVVAAGAAESDAAGRAALRERYEAQVSRIANHSVVVAPRARHFVMLDDPAFLFRELDAFLAQHR